MEQTRLWAGFDWVCDDGGVQDRAPRTAEAGR